MGLFRRVSDVLSANLNDLIEQCENPERLLRQAIREMESALGRAMDGTARGIAHERVLARQLTEQQRTIERLCRSAESAVRRGDDPLARQMLRLKAEQERLSESLSEQIVTAHELSERMRGQISAMRVKLAEARRRMIELSARKQVACVRRQFVTTLDSPAFDGGVLSNFERACARIEQDEAETEALLELLGVDDFREPLDADIEAELLALKETTSHVAP